MVLNIVKISGLMRVPGWRLKGEVAQVPRPPSARGDVPSASVRYLHRDGYVDIPNFLAYLIAY